MKKNIRKSRTSPAKRISKKPETLRERLFDDGWRFLRNDAPGAENPSFDDSSWQTLDLPHDWSLEDLPPVQKDESSTPGINIVPGKWLFRKGDDYGWKEHTIDETGWETVELPCAWEVHSNYTQDNVYGWFRRHIEIPAEIKGRDFDLRLGRIDDVDEAFVNGVRIGGMGSFPPDFATAWNQNRVYRVPASLLRGDGTDVVAVRVFDGIGTGGICDATPEPIRVGPFDTVESPGQRDTGYVLGGIGWYRKTFTLPPSGDTTCIAVRFDGVYMDSDVWLNGIHLGNHPCGYTGFAYHLTPHLKPAGERNVMAVRVRNAGHNSRWYSGSGIYRHTWLTSTHPVHVALWGVWVTTPDVAAGTTVVNVATTVENAGSTDSAVTVNVRIADPKGATVTRCSAAGSVAGNGATAVIPAKLTVKSPRLWSVDSPALYTAQVDIVVDGAVVDCTTTTFGIRTFSFDARCGFVLNGRTLKMKGACMHHDNGLLGSAAIDRAEWRRVEIMKANGYNAIRTAHNPPSPAFLDACDQLGMLVMDESFDMWRKAKNTEDYARFFDAWWRKDTDSMILRDRNHPSIVIWSIGNEIPERGEPDGVKSATMQADHVREMDPTRPVTSAYCGVDDNADPYLAELDVAGYNYAKDRYVLDHKRHPRRVVIATETFPLEAFDYWMGALDNPHVVGDFVWTGMDYLGESGIGFATVDGVAHPSRWPYHTAWCGDIDICGVKAAPSYYRDILWNRSVLEMAVRRPLPEGRKPWISPWGWHDEERSWTWPEHKGGTMQVAVYSSAEQVTLTLNGREIGTQSVSRATKFTAIFEVPYEPGELTAKALVGGRVVAKQTLCTAGAPKKIRLSADRAKIRADRNDLAYITIEVLDAKGTVVPNADTIVKLTLSGPAELAAAGSANPRYQGSYRKPECIPFQGRCMAILRPKGAGRATLRAESRGLTAATVNVPMG